MPSLSDLTAIMYAHQGGKYAIMAWEWARKGHFEALIIFQLLKYLIVFNIFITIIICEVGVCSMLAASKYEETYCPELKDFEFITDNAFNKKQMVRSWVAVRARISVWLNNMSDSASNGSGSSEGDGLRYGSSSFDSIPSFILTESSCQCFHSLSRQVSR